jgi:hypothetical protein
MPGVAAAMSFVNAGGRCALQGWPAIRLATPDGAPLAVHHAYVRATGAWGPFPPTRIVIDHGRSAVSNLLIAAPVTVDPTSSDCRITFDWHVRMPHGRGPGLSVVTKHQWWAAVCPHKSVIAASPLHLASKT